jgi:hypothetical protein
MLQQIVPGVKVHSDHPNAHDGAPLYGLTYIVSRNLACMRAVLCLLVWGYPHGGNDMTSALPRAYKVADYVFGIPGADVIITLQRWSMLVTRI